MASGSAKSRVCMRQLLFAGASIMTVANASGSANAQTAAQPVGAPDSSPANASGSANAQTAAQPVGAADTGAPDAGDIIVTARRRAESLERVPVAVSALNQEQLVRRGVQTQSDLQIAVPGLTIASTENTNNFTYSLRGQSVDAFSNSRPAVLTYFNDVQLSMPSVSSLYDLQSVQVLKGPQGTLFGRNVTGGAVLLSSAQPTNELEGWGTIRIGNLSLREFQGAINVPIVDDKVLLRVATDLDHRNGYQYNLYDGQRLGAQRRQSGRVTLTLKPTDTIASTTVAEYDRSRGNNLDTALYSVYPCGATYKGKALATSAACFYGPTLDATIGVPGVWAAYVAAHPGLFPGGLAAYADVQRARGGLVVDDDAPNFHHGRSFSISNTTTVDLSSNAQLKNIFGYANTYAHDANDLDGSPYPIELEYTGTGYIGATRFYIRQFSDELQLNGTALGNRLKYIVGAYFSHEKDRNFADLEVFDLTPIFPPPAFGAADYRATDRTEAVFAQGTYDLSGLTGITGLSVTAGIRETWDKVGIAQLATSTRPGPPEAKSFRNPSWQVGVEYQATPNFLLYIEQRGSWRAGGFNGAAPPVKATAEGGGNLFLSEKTKDVEVGAKLSTHVDGKRVRLNVALYDQWLDDAQRVAYVELSGTISALTLNIPKTNVKGVEFDSDVQLTPWLEIGAAGAYTDAKFTSSSVGLFGQVFDFGPYANTPKWSGSAFAEVALPVDKALAQVTLRGEVYGQTSFWFTSLGATEAPYTRLPAYKLVNFRLEARNVASTGLTIAGFLKNAFNVGYSVGGLGQGAAFGSNSSVPGEPRTYGVEIGYRF